jgi:hypothetical protein
MPDLKQSLLGHDCGHLRIIAEHWGIALDTSDPRLALPTLVDGLLNLELVSEVIESLPEHAILGLNALVDKKGRIPWVQFIRRFGDVREMGSGKRDRERPDREPISAAEILWYRGLVARAFFDTGRRTEEYAYIPEDLLTLIKEIANEKIIAQTEVTGKVLGRVATASERAFLIPVTDRILDHTCTYLAGLRCGVEHLSFETYPLDFIHALVNQAGLLDRHGIPNPEATRAFLEGPRGEALVDLTQAWLNSSIYNDLHHVPDLQAEGEWTNDPIGTRRFLLGLLSVLPEGAWWCLSALIADIRQHYPDFQRPAGDYDSWFLRSQQNGEFLRGFDHWDQVDGALIRYLISGPLHWLGVLELASTGKDEPANAFRFSRWAIPLLEGKSPQGMSEELDRVHVRSDGRLSVPVLAPRAVRYQLARFCQWEDETVYEYRYRLAPSSLARARGEGLRVTHFLSLLRRHADVIPPNIVTALERWDEYGTEVRLQDVTILRLGSPQILQALRSSRAARFLGDPIGPTTIIVKPGAGEKVLAFLAEMGYFGEVVSDK